jgi:hypothetical protein
MSDIIQKGSLLRKYIKSHHRNKAPPSIFISKSTKKWSIIPHAVPHEKEAQRFFNL